MKKKSKYFIHQYMKYTVKSPITVLTIICIGFSTLFYLVYTTKINIYQTYEASVIIADAEIYLEAKLDKNSLKKPVFWYLDKQSGIYPVDKFDIFETEQGYIVRVVPHRGHITRLQGSSVVFIDLPIKQITILSRILSRGSISDGYVY